MLTARSRAAALTAAYYGAMFFTFGAQLPYWPVWLSDWGLSTAEIGFYLGAATLARITGSTLLPALADRFAIRRWMIGGTTLAAAVVVLLHPTIKLEPVLFVATLVLALVSAPSVPLGEALGLRAAGRFGFAYAPVRAVGSVAFLVANVAVGAWVTASGPGVVIWVMAAGFVVTAALGVVHPGAGAAAVRDQASGQEIAGLLRTPVFVLFALTVALAQGSHGVFYVYSALDWQAQGLTPALIGWLWASGVLAETLIMLGPARAWVVRLGPALALAAAAGAGALRWAGFSFSPAIDWLWALMAMHALTFALGHLAAMAFIAAAVPSRLAASAQGAVSGIVGGSINAGALFLAAIIVQQAGVAWAYLMASTMALGACVLALILAWVWNGGPVSGNN